MFNEYVILHTPQPANGDGVGGGGGGVGLPDGRFGRCSEKMTQTSDGNIWQVSLPNNIGSQQSPQSLQQLSTANLPNSQHSVGLARVADCSDLNLPEAMTCQELLAFSVAFSAALPTGHMTLESFYNSLARTNTNTNNNNNIHHNPTSNNNHDDNNNSGVLVASPHLNSSAANNNNCESINGHKVGGSGGGIGSNNNNNSVAVLPLSSAPHSQLSLAINEDFSCCHELYQTGPTMDTDIEMGSGQRSKFTITLVMIYQFVSRFLSCAQRKVKKMVEHKYFQQGILFAILINTLSMGIEYHDQPPELTVIVETSNIVFSAIFAVEMLLKIVAEGPFRYVANGFNVFDGVIVILR